MGDKNLVFFVAMFLALLKCQRCLEMASVHTVSLVSDFGETLFAQNALDDYIRFCPVSIRLNLFLISGIELGGSCRHGRLSFYAKKCVNSLEPKIEHWVSNCMIFVNVLVLGTFMFVLCSRMDEARSLLKVRKYPIELNLIPRFLSWIILAFVLYSISFVHLFTAVGIPSAPKILLPILSH